MNIIYVIMLTLLVLGLSQLLQRRRLPRAANIADGTHCSLSKRATAAIATRHLLVTFGATADLIAVAAADDVPLGPCIDEPETALDPVAVKLLGIDPETVKMVASEAITAGEDVFAAAGGKVQDLPVAAGTYYKVGRALTAAAADGDEIEVQHCTPLATVVA